MTQVSKKEGYSFDTYGGVDRFASYAYQIREILNTKPNTVLEIGAGDAVVGNYLKRQTSITYTSLDFASDLEPDIVADVRSLPCKDKSYDTVCIFEVLEHLPSEDFEKSIAELVRVSRAYVLISLPHFGPPIQAMVKIPFLPRLRFAWKIPFYQNHIFNGQHYWEIGKRGYSFSSIQTILKKYGTLEQDFVPFENQYHHFFIVRVG